MRPIKARMITQDQLFDDDLLQRSGGAGQNNQTLKPRAGFSNPRSSISPETVTENEDAISADLGLLSQGGDRRTGILDRFFLESQPRHPLKNDPGVGMRSLLIPQHRLAYAFVNQVHQRVRTE